MDDKARQRLAELRAEYASLAEWAGGSDLGYYAEPIWEDVDAIRLRYPDCVEEIDAIFWRDEYL